MYVCIYMCTYACKYVYRKKKVLSFQCYLSSFDIRLELPRRYPRCGEYGSSIAIPIQAYDFSQDFKTVEKGVVAMTIKGTTNNPVPISVNDANGLF